MDKFVLFLIEKIKSCFWNGREWMARPWSRRLGPLLLAAMPALLLRRWEAFFISYLIVWMLWENLLKLRPLNIVFRYFVALDILDAWKPFFKPHPKLLEVGSGPQGFGHLVPYPFWGCDVDLDGNVHPTNMNPIQASGTELPFADESFDIVISLDTLEHIPTDALRHKAIRELMRVTKKALIVGFPAGAESYEADLELRSLYLHRGAQVPVWLEEHAANGLPSKGFIEACWENHDSMLLIPNESLRFHRWMMNMEVSRFWFYAFLSGVFLGFPAIRWASRSLASSDRPYRLIYVLAKDPQLLTPLRPRGKVR